VAEVKASKSDTGSDSKPEPERGRRIIDREPISTVATTKLQPSELDEPEEGECLFHSQMWVKGTLLHFIVDSGHQVYQKNFYWPKLRREVNKYIRSCTACAISKPTTKKQGLYTPLPTFDRPWKSISMDYMLGLPSTKQGNDCVFVVVDHFSKMAILAACKKSITTEAIAKLLFERV
jgi:hypothetical protein